MLAQLDKTLDDIVTSWTAALLANLEDPITRHNLDLLAPKDAQAVTDFVASRSLPDPLDSDFVQALREAFSGLVRVTASLHDLDQTLVGDHGAVTIDELRGRFESWIDGLLKGKDRQKARIVLESNQDEINEARGGGRGA
jgi:hypothetical protein